MDFELSQMLKPTAYLLLAGFCLFAVGAAVLRQRQPAGSRWRELGYLAAFCLAGAGLTLAGGELADRLSLPIRLGLAGLVMLAYGLYMKKRRQ